MTKQDLAKQIAQLEREVAYWKHVVRLLNEKAAA